MGTTSPVEARQPTSMSTKDWWIYRTNQRIGVAVADNPAGPWQRFEKPVLDVSEDPTAPDAYDKQLVGRLIQFTNKLNSKKTNR